MARARSLPVAAIFAAGLLAGCGSSSKSSTTTTAANAANSQSATTSAQSSYAPATSAATGGGDAATVITAKSSKLGTILAAGPKRLTVYLFEGDKGSTSSCSKPCTAVWPPVATSGKPQAGGAALAAELGTITRSDGTTQVTYKGHPLYYFAKDGDAGDAYGQGINGFGASWYVMSPSGSKIDTS